MKGRKSHSAMFYCLKSRYMYHHFSVCDSKRTEITNKTLFFRSQNLTLYTYCSDCSTRFSKHNWVLDRLSFIPSSRKWVTKYIRIISHSKEESAWYLELHGANLHVANLCGAARLLHPVLDIARSPLTYSRFQTADCNLL